MDDIGLENASELAACVSAAAGPLRIVSGHVHGIYHGQIGGHPASTAQSLCSAFALDLSKEATIGFMSGARGCALIDTEQRTEERSVGKGCVSQCRLRGSQDYNNNRSKDKN